MNCNSCKKGFDGKNGNGYQPCGCPPPTTESVPSVSHKPFAIDIIRGAALAAFLLAAAIICCNA